MNIGSMEIRESKETNSKNDKNGRVLYLDYVKGISIILMLFSRPLKRQFPTNNQYISD